MNLNLCCLCPTISAVLDCPSEVVKSQVFLLLGAACKHENGLDAVLTALESNKVGVDIASFPCRPETAQAWERG